jgi:hypothetical protein
VTGSGGLYGCETSRIPYFLYNRLTDGNKVVRLIRLSRFTPPRRFLLYISVRGWVDPKAGRIRSIGNPSDCIGNRCPDFLSCSIVPHPTTLARAPIYIQRIRCADHATSLYPQTLALTSPTSGSRSVGIIRSRTHATEFVFYLYLSVPVV